MNGSSYRSERILMPISTDELERRWREIRRMMAEKGLDCLLMQSNSQMMGGYVRWFTDVPAVNGYPITVLFPLEGGMILISSGGPPLPSYPEEWALRGVEESLPAPYFLPFNYTKHLDAEIVVRKLRSKGARTVGILGENYIPASMYNYLRENLPSVDLVEAAGYVDEIKAVKSEEELSFIRRCVEIQDIGMKETARLLKPGMREFELRAALEHMMMDLGSEEKWIMIGSAPPGGNSKQKPPFLQNRVIEKGDEVCVMIEVNGPGGFYGEVGRIYCLGRPSAEIRRMWSDAVEAQRLSASMLTPGRSPSEIFAAHNAFLTDRGYPPEGRLYAHGQGYDLVERPAIRPDEPMLIRDNMLVAIHPRLVSKAGQVYCCDNYFVAKGGAVRLHATPQELIEL
jgi:Xaa-Pro aminopeptidase